MKWPAGYRGLLLLLAAAFLAASYWPWAERLEGWVYQGMTRVLPKITAANHVAVVAVDQRALAELGPWPWPARTQTGLLAVLGESRAAAIGWMLPVDAGAVGDLAAVWQQIPRLVLAQPAVINPERQGLVVEGPYPITALPLAAQTPPPYWRFLAPFTRPPTVPFWAQAQPLNGMQGMSLGVLPLPAAKESLWREPLAITAEPESVASLALALTLRSRGMTTRLASILAGRGVQMGATRVATDAGLRIYPRPALGDVPQFSAAAVLAGELPAEALRNKIVLVGATAPQLSYANPAPGGARLTPVAWQAQVINALQNQTLVNTPYWSLGAQRGALLVVLIYLLLLPRRLRGRLGLVLGGVLALLIMNASLLLLVVDNTWLPLTLPALLLLLGQVVVNTHHGVAQNLQRQQLRGNRAYAELAANLRSQGQLDKALAALRECSLDGPVKEALYDLGLDFERRRQFAKALEAYDLIAAGDAGFRDVRERRERHQGGETVTLAATRVMNGIATTLVVNDPHVARPVLGRYEIERELGRGAMGTVYLGRDPRIGRTVAIKTLALSEEFESKQLEEVRRRFHQEAETAGRLSHPNIVTIYDVGEEHDLAYIAMDYIQGKSLDQHTQAEALLPLADVFGIGVQVAEALDYAHGQKVVHRDVKPGNIIYDQGTGRLKVTDFGIACLTDNSKTRTGTVLGSPFYMSPEQIAGRRVDGRADLYSLGVTLYQLLCGRLPFEADSLTSLMYKIANDKPQPIRKVRKELPACVTRFLNKALEKDPARRFAHGESMAETIKRCAEQSGIGYRKG